MTPVTDNPQHATTFQAHRHEVYAWALRIVGQHHDALDIAQDVFLRWEKQMRTDPPASPRGWLRTVTLNCAVDALRKRPRLRPVAHDISEIEAREPGMHPHDRARLRDDLAVAISRLTESQRSVLVAKVHDELTFAEIARETGLAVPTVKTHYLRALRSVRDAVAPRWSLNEEEGTER